MAHKQILALYDFDGTITNNDTFIDIIRHTFSFRAFMCGFLLHLPEIIAFKLKLYPNWKAKEKIFNHFFGGMHIDDFNKICQSYFEFRHESILRKDAIESIKKHQNAGNRVAIVSASIKNWIQPFADYLGIENIISTTAEISNDKLTGKFSNKNCHGTEKVEKSKIAFPDRDKYTIYAYGDSSGDKPMLAYANKAFYRTFE